MKILQHLHEKYSGLCHRHASRCGLLPRSRSKRHTQMTGKNTSEPKLQQRSSHSSRGRQRPQRSIQNRPETLQEDELQEDELQGDELQEEELQEDELQGDELQSQWDQRNQSNVWVPFSKTQMIKEPD